MAEIFESVFYEVFWRSHAWNTTKDRRFPLPWWSQQYFRAWKDSFDGGLFLSKEGAFASNACYRYWTMIGVKDAAQETLVGQAGEVEPVYDTYALGFFLFEEQTKTLRFPQFWGQDGASLTQGLDGGFRPVVVTDYTAPGGVRVTARALSTTVAPDQKAVTLARFAAAPPAAPPAGPVWFGLFLGPVGPSGFQRNDRAGRYRADRRISFMSYDAAAQLIQVNSWWGPIFQTAPTKFGLYGNTGADAQDYDRYLTDSGFTDLATTGTPNGATTAFDSLAGLCTGVFLWPTQLHQGTSFSLDVVLPVDDFRGGDVAALRTANATTLDAQNTAYWNGKLASGLQAALPSKVAHLWDLYRACRANLLVLADDGAIHPGPTIYDDFWIRDSSVEGVACALAGDTELARRQFAYHYPDAFNYGPDVVGGVPLAGLFGRRHEIDDREWDANGQALWAIGRKDRLLAGSRFGQGLYLPYVLEGARWFNRSRNAVGLLPQGWSAEHLGGKNETHYWDHLWALAGLYEAAQLARRSGAPQEAELWGIFDDVKRATNDSILWALGRQRELGSWETFIPASPEAVGRLDSTIIGAVAYYHPCRLYMGQKMGTAIDDAARATLETIWAHFIDGGFRHDSAWQAYGPYLTLQLAHAFLLLGDVWRMDRLLGWAVWAATPTVSTPGGAGRWAGALSSWNEQHAYPIAKDFLNAPGVFPDHWYMGDIPHGWACAELMLLLRDILLFEADEDGSPHLYVAPGVLPAWLPPGETLTVSNAPTILGASFGYELAHVGPGQLRLKITQAPACRLVFPCRFGTITNASVVTGGGSAVVSGQNVVLAAGTTDVSIQYA